MHVHLLSVIGSPPLIIRIAACVRTPMKVTVVWLLAQQHQITSSSNYAIHEILIEGKKIISNKQIYTLILKEKKLVDI